MKQIIVLIIAAITIFTSCKQADPRDIGLKTEDVALYRSDSIEFDSLVVIRNELNTLIRGVHARHTDVVIRDSVVLNTPDSIVLKPKSLHLILEARSGNSDVVWLGKIETPGTLDQDGFSWPRCYTDTSGKMKVCLADTSQIDSLYTKYDVQNIPPLDTLKMYYFLVE